MLKLDHTFSRKHKLSVAYFYSDGASCPMRRRFCSTS